MSERRPPARVVLIKPCCIGDVVFATPLLAALRRAYPQAHIAWAAGSMAIPALQGHPHLNSLVETGPRANPASRPVPMLRLVRALRQGQYDLAVVPDRSRLLGLATLLSRIRARAGLDSGRRGFAYTIPARIHPAQVRHEAEIYLDVGRALGLDVSGCWANVPAAPAALEAARAILRQHHITPDSGDGTARLVIVHPGGGVNAGMSMTVKRWPADRFGALAARLAPALGAEVAVIGAASDREPVRAFTAAFRALAGRQALDLAERLSLREIAALASRAAVYLGNDNGVGHLAAAAGARVLMIFGPSDPRRYAPYVPSDRARYAWRPIALPAGGVRAGAPRDFDWARDGVSVEEAWAEACALLGL